MVEFPVKIILELSIQSNDQSRAVPLTYRTIAVPDTGSLHNIQRLLSRFRIGKGG
jgi:hypothetical protein